MVDGVAATGEKLNFVVTKKEWWMGLIDRGGSVARLVANLMNNKKNNIEV
jgi:hypothetical protein